MNNSNVAHLSYVGDSIIGEKCNLGAGTIIANLRHDGKNIEWEAKGELMDTERRKLGAIIANNVKTGIGTMIYPGRTMTSNTSTKPGEIVKKNIK
jgi:bifunctional UDP-N-acetylglucosamine pyrophosphorylase/glucosamine-1-phosphate N-acetyltransferase